MRKSRWQRNPRSLKWPVSVLLWTLLGGGAFAQDAPELQRLQSAYNAAIQRADRPITQSYIQELSRLRDTYLATNRAAAAQQVEGEIKLMTDRIALMDKPAPIAAVPPAVAGARPPVPSAPRSPGDGRTTPPAPGGAGQGGVISDTRATIPANSADGYALGPLRKGDVVTLQYVDGLWKSFGNVGSENPDAVLGDRKHGDDNRMVIARASSNGYPGGVIAMVPSLTAKNPFVFHVPEDRVDLVLRINKFHDKNPGKVIYQVKISR